MADDTVNNKGEILPLPADLQYLQEATIAEIIVYDPMDPTMWHLVEKRIRAHPSEARDTDGDGDLPIHSVLWVSNATEYSLPNTAAPLSLIEFLIEAYPAGLNIQNQFGQVPLHGALEHPCIDCFRAVLYNGNVDATTTQDKDGETPLHMSILSRVSLDRLWELLCYNPQCVTIQKNNGMSAFQDLQYCVETYRCHQVTRQYAKLLLLKMVANYNHVPPVPNGEMIQMIESHLVCAVLVPRLESGNDDFILHVALVAHCPSVLVEALVQIFPNQLQQQQESDRRLPLHLALHHGLGASVRILASAYPGAMFRADPAADRLPIEQAILNVGTHGSLENVDALNVLLRADPAFLERLV